MTGRIRVRRLEAHITDREWRAFIVGVQLGDSDSLARALGQRAR